MVAGNKATFVQLELLCSHCAGWILLGRLGGWLVASAFISAVLLGVTSFVLGSLEQVVAGRVGVEVAPILGIRKAFVIFVPFVVLQEDIAGVLRNNVCGPAEV